MYMIMFVLDDAGQLDHLLASWEGVGIRGATIVESTGIHRLRRKNVHLRYAFQPSELVEEGHLTLFVIVENEQQVQDCLHATERAIGDLHQPDTGVFAAWPLAVVRGGMLPDQGE